MAGPGLSRDDEAGFPENPRRPHRSFRKDQLAIARRLPAKHRPPRALSPGGQISAAHRSGVSGGKKLRSALRPRISFGADQLEPARCDRLPDESTSAAENR